MHRAAGLAGVPPGTSFYVDGLSFRSGGGSPGSIHPALYVVGAPTEVVLSDVIATAGFPEPPGPGLYVAGGAVVHAARCTFTGWNSTTGSIGAGAYLESSMLVADGCTFIGGGPGAGSGVFLWGGFATLSRCTALGGASTVGSGGHGVAATLGAFARIAGASSGLVRGGVGNAVAANGVAVYADGTSSAVVHGAVNLQSAGGGSPLTTGSVTTGAVALPYVSITGTSTPAGELQATQPVTVTFNGVIPLAPFSVVVDIVPWFSTGFSSVLVGELLVHVPVSFAFQGTLDGAGMGQVTLTPSVSIPYLTNIPLFVQFGVLDAVAGNVRASNCAIRIFQ